MDEIALEEDTISKDADQELVSQKDQIGDEGLAPGSSFARYMIVEKLGQGGMGVVYSAYDPKLDRRVALKVLAVSGLTEKSKKAKQSRMLREAQAMAQLSHPNVASVFDVGAVGDTVFIAMEFIGGQTLRQWLAESPRSVGQIIDVFYEAGKGLAAAHQVGLVHRDFKPDNVMMGVDKRVRVLDFGLARVVDAKCDSWDDPPRQPSQAVSVDDLESSSESLLGTSLTKDGTLVGTPAYMSPEQLYGVDVDAQCDQFSFCVALFEALYSKRPHDGKSVRSLLNSIHNKKRLRSIDSPHVSKHLRQVLERGLAAAAEQRFPDMDSLLIALRDDPERRSRKRRTRILQVSLATLSICLIFALWWVDRSRIAAQCSQVDVRLSQVWNASVKQQLAQKFSRASETLGKQIWQRVEQTISSYADSWRAMSTQNCQATRIQAHQSERVMDLRMACLERKVDELDAINQLFANADLQVVQKADNVLAGLSSLHDCTDIENILRRSHRLRPPQGSRQISLVQIIRQKLNRAKVLYHSGKFKEGISLVNSLEQEVKSASYQPVEAETSFWLGRLCEGSGEYRKSEEKLLQAYEQALSCKHDELAAQSANWLIFVVGECLSRTKEGILWGRVAEVILGSLPGALAIKAEWHNNLGVVETNAQAARKHRKKARELRTSVFGPNHSLVAQSVMNLATSYLRVAQYEKAENLYREAIEILKKTVGSQHPETAVAMNNLGVVYSKTKKFAKALQLHSQALQIRERFLGPGHPLTGQSHRNLAIVLRKMKRFDLSLVHHLRSLQITENSVGTHSIAYAFELESLAKTFLRKNNTTRAQELVQRSISIVEKEFGITSTKLAPYLKTLARIKIASNRLLEAHAAYQRILSLCQSDRCEKDYFAAASFDLARLLWKRPTQQVRALGLARQALTWYSKRTGWSGEHEEVSTWLASQSTQSTQSTP